MSVNPSSFILISSNPSDPAIVFSSEETSLRSRRDVAVQSSTTESTSRPGREVGKIVAKVLVLISLLASAVGLFALVVLTPSCPVFIVGSVLLGLTTTCFFSSLVALILKCLRTPLCQIQAHTT